MLGAYPALQQWFLPDAYEDCVKRLASPFRSMPLRASEAWACKETESPSVLLWLAMAVTETAGATLQFSCWVEMEEPLAAVRTTG